MDEKQLEQIVNEISILTREITDFFVTELRSGGSLPTGIQQARSHLALFLRQSLSDPQNPPIEGIIDSLDELSTALEDVRDALKEQEDRIKQQLPGIQLTVYQEYYNKINDFQKRIGEIKNKLKPSSQAPQQAPSPTPKPQAQQPPAAQPPKQPPVTPQQQAPQQQPQAQQPPAAPQQQAQQQPQAQAQQQPTLVNLQELTRAITAFERLITTLNNIADKIPTGMVDENTYLRFLTNTYSPMQNTIWQLIAEIRSLYPNLAYIPGRSVEFFREVRRRLIEDTYEWEQHVAESPLTTDITMPGLAALSDLRNRLDNITDVDVVRAAHVLDSGERATLEIYQFVTQELMAQAPRSWKEGLKHWGLKILSWISGIPLVQPASKRFREKVREVIGRVSPKLSAAQRIQRRPRPARPAFRFLSDKRRKEMFTEMRTQGAVSYPTYVLTLYDGLRALWGFLWSLPPLPPHSGGIPIDRLDPAVFGPLEPAIKDWKEKGIKLRDALDNYLKPHFTPPPGAAVGREIARMKQMGLDQLLPEFIDASKELVRQYKQLPDDERKKYVNFERVLFRPDGLPLLERLVALILLGQQVSKSVQALLQALLPQGDRDRQQWLIEEKHTL
jgi:outer membrane biosynthesis protein TonB